jgi:hypothetical protein
VTKIISIMAVAFALAAGSITVVTVQHRFIATYENRQSWIEPNAVDDARWVSRSHLGIDVGRDRAAAEVVRVSAGLCAARL